MLLLITILFLAAGFLCLALQQDQHGKRIFGHYFPAKKKKLLVNIAWVLMVVSVVITIIEQGIGFAVLVWPLLASVCAAVVSAVVTILSHVTQADSMGERFRGLYRK